VFQRITTFGLNHRASVTLFLTLVTIACALGIPDLKVGTDFSRLIADTDPDKQVYRLVAEEFGSDNRTLVYAQDDNLWTTEKLSSLERLHSSLEQLEFVEKVESLFTLRSIRGEKGKIDSRLILDEVPDSEPGIEQAKANALYNPMIVGNYLSQTGTITTLMVSVKPDSDKPNYEAAVHQALEQTLMPYNKEFQTLFQIGAPRINTELNQALQEDLRLLGPLSAVVLVTTILVFLRSGFGAMLPLVTSALSIIWTFGMMGWLGIPLTLLSAMLPSLIIAIGATEDTHMMASYLQALPDSKKPLRLTSSRLMIKKMGIPVLLTVTTTALGFASNAFNDISLIREFALVSTFAIVANGIITWLLVPIALSLFGPRRSRLKDRDDEVSGLPGLLVKLFGLTRQHFPRGILVVTGILCFFFLYQAASLNVTNDPLSYFKHERDLTRQVHQVQDDLSGLRVFFISLQSDDMKAFLDPKNVAKLAEIQKFITQQNVFDLSVSLADYLALVNREFHNGNHKYYKAPTNRDLIAQYLMFFHRNDLSSYVSSDYRRANIVVRHSLSDSRSLNQHIAELKETVRRIAGSDIKVFVVGENLMINAAADKLLMGQVKSLAVLLLMIFLIMSAMFTSFKGGMIAMIPSIIPITLMFGVMGLLDIPLNPGTAMVAVIAIGIAVDGTVHLLSRYNELCRSTSNYEQAVQKTVRNEALPAVTTALALSLGFGLLLFSQFSVVAQFGALSAATMLFSIFANLLITPIIMTKVRLVGLHDILTMSVHKQVLKHSPLFQGMSKYEIRKTILISELKARLK